MMVEAAAVWYVPATGSDTHAILIKAPLNILKAIVDGVKVELIFAVVRHSGKTYLCNGFRVWDDPKAAFSAFGLQRDESEHLALSEILERQSTPVFLFDDICRCVSWTEVFIQSPVSELSDVLKDGPYVGPFDELVVFALDKMENMLEGRNLDEQTLVHSDFFFALELSFSDFTHIQIHGVGANSAEQFLVTGDEGPMHEQIIWHLLEGLFDSNIFRSPETLLGGKWRELTDIFCSGEYGNFLIEAKAISVLQTDHQRSTTRRVSNLQKQVKKALSQLEGAIRAIRSGQEIRDHAQNTIDFDRSLVPHALVLVSEILPFGDWDGIVKEIAETAMRTGAMVHVFDIKELLQFVRASESSINKFDYLLMKRFENFVAEPSVFRQTKFIREEE